MVNQLTLMGAMAVAAAWGAGGQILLNLGAKKLQLTLLGLLSNIYLWGFVALYGFAVIINLAAYRLGGKVSLMYPVISISYIISAVLAWKLLGEPFNWWTVAGCCAIMLGVSCIGYGSTVMR